MSRRLRQGGILAALVSLWASVALAKTSVTLPYGVQELWPSAVRFLRIDRGCTIREKDAEAGYVLFDMTEGTRTYRGALELVGSTGADGREVTKAVFSLPDLPRHFEIVLTDKLAAKARDDLGTPPSAPPRREPPVRKPAPADADAGAK